MGRSHVVASLAALAMLGSACEESPPPGDASLPSDAAREAGPREDAGAAEDAAGEGPDAAAPAGACHVTPPLGPPTSELELPVRGREIYVNDVQARFPEVDWATLDRLYIPAGEYDLIYLGNLPQRDRARPLVITNRGGQVVVRTTRYGISMVGGSGWILTGHHDAEARTGDPAFPGHAGCDYPGSRGRYGIHVIGDEGPGQTLVAARSPAGSEPGAGSNFATDFEISFLEIERAGFAGLMVKSDDQPAATMRSVSLHDLYVHDTVSEGVYVGNTSSTPQHTLEDLVFRNNRVLRAGTECAQFGHLVRGEIDHNVFGLCAIDWRDSFSAYQDNGLQLGVRRGTTRVHHDVVVGASDNLLTLFPQPRDGDEHTPGDAVELSDLVLSSTRGGIAWMHGAGDGVTEWRFSRWAVRSATFSRDEVYTSATPPTALFSTSTTTTVRAAEIVWDRESVPVDRFFAGGSAPVELGAGIEAGVVPELDFRDFMPLPPGTPYERVERWAATARRAGDPPPPVTYEPGDYVVHHGVVYECLRSSAGEPPDTTPSAWRSLGLPTDDVRFTPASPHRPRGLLEP
jgi:hypothetical protein